MYSERILYAALMQRYIYFPSYHKYKIIFASKHLKVCDRQGINRLVVPARVTHFKV